MSATASPGDRFGGAFTLVRPLGSGGTAEVWLAREDDLGREDAWHAEAQFLPWPILVGERGGTLERYDEWNETLFCVTNAIRRASGVERATLECRGFSDLILNRASLDAGLFVSGSGSVADVLPGGRIRNRRWFDPEDPL